MSHNTFSKVALILTMGSSLAYAIDYEQQLLIENQGLDLTLLKGKAAQSTSLTSGSAPTGSSEDNLGLGSFTASPDEPSSDALSDLLGSSDPSSTDAGLDSLLGNTPMPETTSTDSGLDSLLGDLDATPTEEPTGLEGLDALLEAPATPEPAAPSDDPLGGLDSLLADAGSPEAPAAPGGLSGLDSILGDLGGGIEVEEVKIEGLGTEEKKEEKPKVKAVEEKKEPKAEMKKEKKEQPEVKKKKTKKAPKQENQDHITPLDRKLITKSDIKLGDLVDEIAKLGGWELEKSEEFIALSSKDISLSFQNVPLKFLLKWVSIQTGLKYKLKEDKLSI